MTKMDTETELERRTRAVLEASLTRVDARTRSRLNQARHTALEHVRRRALTWRGFKLVPVTGGAVAAAALAVAFVLLVQRPHPVHSSGEGAQASFEVLDLVADEDNLSLMEDYDHSFYEWAAAQGQATGGDTSDGSAGG